MIFKFFNLLFRVFLIFALCFVWVRYFIDELWLTLLYTALLTISIELIIHFIFVKRNSKKILQSKEEKLAEQITTTFIFSKEESLNYFYNVAKIHFNAKKTSKYIIYEKEHLEKSIDISETDGAKVVLYPYYSYDLVTPQNLVEILNDTKKVCYDKLIICGNKIDKETYKLAQKITDTKIILLDSFDTYIEISKKYNYYPTKLKDIQSINKPSLKELLKHSLSRKNSKGFLISSLILLFSSFIVRLNIYYVIVSSLLLLFSLLSFFLPQKPRLNEESIL